MIRTARSERNMKVGVFGLVLGMLAADLWTLSEKLCAEAASGARPRRELPHRLVG